MNKTVTFRYDKFFKDEIALDEAVESEMYEQLIKNCARSIDIDFAKTPLVDLITGYQRCKILDSRIDKAVTRIKTIINIIKEQPTDNIHTDMYIIGALNSLLHILEEVKENEKQNY